MWRYNVLMYGAYLTQVSEQPETTMSTTANSATTLDTFSCGGINLAAPTYLTPKVVLIYQLNIHLYKHVENFKKYV